MLEFESEDVTPFPHKEITEAIIGSAFEVYNHLGYGFLHRVYQRSLQVELTRRGFIGDLERRTTVRYKEVLKATGLKIGILLNFGRYKVEYRRFIF
jgi:hypothetical protein